MIDDYELYDFAIEEKTIRDKAYVFYHDFLAYVSLEKVYEEYAFPQYGQKSNELYYTHVIKGVFLGISILPLQTEKDLLIFKIFTVAYFHHDINKIYIHRNPSDKSKKGISMKMWSFDTIIKEIEHMDEISGKKLTACFPEWREYSDEICIAIRGHSKTYNYNMSFIMGYNLSINEKGKKFDAHDMMYVVKLMQLVDIMDLIVSSSGSTISIDFYTNEDMTDSKALSFSQSKLISFIENNISAIDPLGKRFAYKLRSISILSDFDQFESIKINACIDAITKKYNILPFSSTFDGTYFIIPEDIYEKLFADDILKKEIAESLYIDCAKRFDEMIIGFINENIREGKLLTNDAGGLKPETYILQSPNEKEKMQSLFDYMKSENFKGLAYTSNKGIDIKSSRYTNSQTNVYKYVEHPNEQFMMWKDNEELLKNDELWKIAQLLRTTMSILSTYSKRKKSEKTNFDALFNGLFSKLNITDEVNKINSFIKKDKKGEAPIAKIYNRTNAIQHIIAYILVIEHKMSAEAIIDAIEEYVLSCLNEYPSIEKFKIDAIENIERDISIFGYYKIADSPIYNTNYRCSNCGKELHIDKKDSKAKILEKYQWLSEFSIAETKVEAFSNFLIGGMQDRALRLICNNCKVKNYVNKLSNSINDDKHASFYIHSYYPSAVPYAFVRALKVMLRKVGMHSTQKGIMSINFDTTRPMLIDINADDSYKGFVGQTAPSEIEASPIISTSFKFSKKISKTQINYVEQYWRLLDKVLNYAISTNMKIMVSKFPRIASNSHINLKSILSLQDCPSEYSVLFDDIENITYVNAQKATKQMKLIEKIIGRILISEKSRYKYSEYVNFLRIFNGDIINDIDFIMKLITNNENVIKKKSKSPMGFVIYYCLNDLKSLYELRGINMPETNLEKMAKLTLKQSSKNFDQSKYQITKSFDILLDILSENHDDDIEIILADAQQRIMDSLSNDEYYKNHKGLLVSKVKEFINIGRKLILDDYKGDINTILDKSQHLLNAYAAFMNNYIAQKSKDKKQRESEKSSKESEDKDEEEEIEDEEESESEIEEDDDNE